MTATVDADGSCAFSMARITTTPYKENVAFLRLAVVPVDVLDGPPEGCHAIGYTEALYLVGKLSRSLNNHTPKRAPKAAAAPPKTEAFSPPPLPCAGPGLCALCGPELCDRAQSAPKRPLGAGLGGEASQPGANVSPFSLEGVRRA